MPVTTPRELGEIGAAAAARKYGLELKPGSSGFWDARYRSNGRKVSIKSASHSRADGPGVVRVWKENLRELQQVRGSVVVVIVSRDAPERPVRKITRVSPSEVLDAASGRWRRSQQATMMDRTEARIPWPELVKR